MVADISCKACNTVVGWKYVDAREEDQRYKIGKFILETARVVGEKAWEDINDMHESRAGYEEVIAGEVVIERQQSEDDMDVVVFDSEDEDECDDLFAGIWTAEAAGRRRKGLRTRN